ncbi:MAG: ankyrin repeat protein 50-like [Acidobacteria bacterium]|nr:ankyrin repeat protein 50-like [Acidobacteriota bacterium]
MSQNILRLLVSTLVLGLLTLLASCTPRPGVPATPGSGPTASAPAPRSADELALLDAAIKGDTAGVKTLLDKGVTPNTKDGDGRTPLTEAAYRGHTEIVKLLIDHGGDLWARKKDGETPVTMAAGHTDTVELIRKSMDLIDAARIGNDKAVKELLDKGAYVNAKDADGRTPLTEAAWNNRIDTVKLLLEKGADPNLRKNDGATPLGIATGQGNKEIEELLKKAGGK